MVQGTCPACFHDGMSVFIEIEAFPIHCNVLWPSREAALHAPRGDIRLGFCESCGMVYNVAFDPNRMQYTPAYENSLHFSPRFQAYAQELAARLIEQYRLRGKNIVEIGCGKGEFLSMLCAKGRNRGFGFDPSYDDQRDDGGDAEAITFIRDFYSEKYAEYAADLICCRQVLEHIPQPQDFLWRLRRVIGNRQDVVVFFEVPNVLYTLRDFGIWDIIYEHCSYFSMTSLTHLFQATGFTVRQVSSTFGDQFLCLEASPAATKCHREMDSATSLGELSRLVAAFSERYRNKLNTWNEQLRRWCDTGKRVVVWGAGSKGTTFLNTVKAGRQVQYAVDINPHKQGRYIAGTGQRIVAPEYLRDYRPDTILVMNPVYEAEICNMMRRFGVTTKVALV